MKKKEKVKKVDEHLVSLQGLFVFYCALNCVLTSHFLREVSFLLCTVPEALSDGPNCLPAPFMTNLCSTQQNQTVCFDQPVDIKDYKHFRADVTINISRMVESHLTGIA